MTQLNILALADIHYIGTADHTCKLHRRKSKLALEFVQRILDSVDIHTIDVIALMGDLVDNGNAPGADNDLETLRSNLVKCGKPIIVIPGNHDATPGVVLDIFGDYEGLHEIKGYQLVTFVDKYGKDDAAERNLGKMKSIFSNLDSARPIIVMQHSPIYPPIDSSYPYNIKNAEEVMKFYTNEGVTLSISGHAHWGIAPVVQDNVSYMTCPALCEEPYRYCLISLKGKDYEVKEQSLAF